MVWLGLLVSLVGVFHSHANDLSDHPLFQHLKNAPGPCEQGVLAERVKLDFEIPLDGIISGGQTGADRAGLDAALAYGIPIGGWNTPNGMAFDGPLDTDRYPLINAPNMGGDLYKLRSEWNARDSDGSIGFMFNGMTGGTTWTQDTALAQEGIWAHRLSPQKRNENFSKKCTIGLCPTILKC